MFPYFQTDYVDVVCQLLSIVYEGMIRTLLKILKIWNPFCFVQGPILKSCHNLNHTIFMSLQRRQLIRPLIGILASRSTAAQSKPDID